MDYMMLRWEVLLILFVLVIRIPVILFYKHYQLKKYGSEKKVQQSLSKVYEEYPDLTGNINVLIHYVSQTDRKFVVFLDRENDLDWETKDEMDDELKQNPFFHEILGRIDVLAYDPSVKYFGAKMKKEFCYVLGRVLVLAIDNYQDLANELIKRADSYLQARKGEITRWWQLTSTLLIYFILVVSVIFSVMFDEVVPYEIRSGIFIVFYAATGSVLSIFQKAGTMSYDCQSGQFMNILQVLVKILIGIISGFFVVALFHAGIIFQMFQNVESTENIVFILCLISGFSERLAPSLLERFAIEEEKHA